METATFFVFAGTCFLYTHVAAVVKEIYESHKFQNEICTTKYQNYPTTCAQKEEYLKGGWIAATVRHTTNSISDQALLATYDIRTWFSVVPLVVGLALFFPTLKVAWRRAQRELNIYRNEKKLKGVEKQCMKKSLPSSAPLPCTL